MLHLHNDYVDADDSYAMPQAAAAALTGVVIF